MFILRPKNQYYAKGVVKMKDTDSGEWIDAVSLYKPQEW